MKNKQLNEILEYAAKRGIVIPPDLLLELGHKQARDDLSELRVTLTRNDLPIFTLTKPGAVPAPEKKGLILASEGWKEERAPGHTVYYGVGSTGGGGVTAHSLLTGLDYASAGHTGFQPAGSYLTVETDPVYLASQAANITAQMITDLENLSGSNSGAFQRVLTANLTLADGECAILKSYIDLNDYNLTLDGDADLVIL